MRPSARAPPDFSRQLGRDSPGKDEPQQLPLDYRVEDVPLSLLAGYPGVRGVPDFGKMRPHEVLAPERE